MTLTQAVIAIGTVGLLLVALYGPWQAICTDYTRQVLFETRDAIFDLAREGRLSFDSREYGAIRSSLQAQIRFAHELTLPRFAFLGAVLAANGNFHQKSGLNVALERISDAETRERVRALIDQANRALLLMLYFKSPVMILLMPLFIALLAVLAVARRARLLFRAEQRAATIIQVEAENASPA